MCFLSLCFSGTRVCESNSCPPLYTFFYCCQSGLHGPSIHVQSKLLWKLLQELRRDDVTTDVREEKSAVFYASSPCYFCMNWRRNICKRLEVDDVWLGDGFIYFPSSSIVFPSFHRLILIERWVRDGVKLSHIWRHSTKNQQLPAFIR